MNKYSPGKTPDAADWLGTDEGLRIELVQRFHDRMRTRLPNPRLHATFHVIVENQLAMAEPAVVATLARLQDEGLNRHDAIHAVGSVLAEHIYELLKGQGAAVSGEPNAAYAEKLEKLTAAGWQHSG